MSKPRGDSFDQHSAAMRWSLVLGVASIGVGLVLLIDPFRSIGTLRWLVALGLAITAVNELTSPSLASRMQSRVIAGLWLGAALVAVTWPGISVQQLAAVIGISLAAGGLIKLISATKAAPGSRAVLAISGLTNVVVGVLVVSWPAITVLIVALLAGLRTIVFGVGQLLTLRHPAAEEAIPEANPDAPRSRWSNAMRLVGAVVALVLALAGVVISAALHDAQPDEPTAFYLAPSPLPDGPPGTIIRSEVMDGQYANAITYRVLYLSTALDGSPTAVSGYIVVPNSAAPAGGRKVLAYTHGTVGVSPRCAPSLTGPGADPLAFEGGNRFVADGYVIAATDYQGLGTPGPHPYLVGSVEAMNALDSVRAARNLSQAQAGSAFAVWGHSQGGHAALFTSQMAASYAPELQLQGVAAGGPVPDLVELFKVNIETQVGKILISMALSSWARVYNLDLAQVATPAAQVIIDKIAMNCLYDPTQILGSVPGSLTLNLTFLRVPLWEVEPWKTIVQANNPGNAPIGVPILIAQGDADPIVAPATTEALVQRLCTRGEDVELLTAPGVGHIDLSKVVSEQVADWIADRFAGVASASECNA